MELKLELELDSSSVTVALFDAMMRIEMLVTLRRRRGSTDAPAGESTNVGGVPHATRGGWSTTRFKVARRGGTPATIGEVRGVSDYTGTTLVRGTGRRRSVESQVEPSQDACGGSATKLVLLV